MGCYENWDFGLAACDNNSFNRVGEGHCTDANGDGYDGIVTINSISSFGGCQVDCLTRCSSLLVGFEWAAGYCACRFSRGSLTSGITCPSNRCELLDGHGPVGGTGTEDDACYTNTGWDDGDGNSCVDYVNNGWCNGGQFTAAGEEKLSSSDSSWSSFRFPDRNCCVCHSEANIKRCYSNPDYSPQACPAAAQDLGRIGGNAELDENSKLREEITLLLDEIVKLKSKSVELGERQSQVKVELEE